MGAHKVAVVAVWSGLLEKRRESSERESHLRQDASIRGETGDGDANVVVDADELLLIRSEFAGGALLDGKFKVRADASRVGVGVAGQGVEYYLQSEKEDMGVGAQSYGSGPLFDCFESIFHLWCVWDGSGRAVSELGQVGRVRRGEATHLVQATCGGECSVVRIVRVAVHLVKRERKESERARETGRG